MLEACFMLFAKFYLSELLLLVAVVTAYYAQCGIHGVEDCSHRLVVGDALGVVAFHDSLQCIRSLHCLLFNDFVVLDNTPTERRLISSSVKNLLATLMMPFLPIFLEGRL